MLKKLIISYPKPRSNEVILTSFSIDCERLIAPASPMLFELKEKIKVELTKEKEAIRIELSFIIAFIILNLKVFQKNIKLILNN